MKKALSLIVVTIMLLATFTACGNSAPAPSDAGSSEAVSSAAPAPQPSAPASWAPKKDVEFVIPASAGGGSDLWARMMSNAVTSNKLSDVNWVPVNKGGGAGAVGYNYCATKKGDEYTLLSLHSGVPVSSYVAGWEHTYDSYIDIICIMAGDDVTLCTKADGPYKDIESLLEAARKNPGTIRFGSDQRLNISQYGYELIQKFAGVEMNYVQFDSSGDAATALLGGHVDVAILNPSECLGQVEAKTFIPIVTFAPERLGGLFKDTPTFIEAGYPDIVMREFRGLAGNVGMPTEAKQYYEGIAKQLMETKEFQEYCSTRNLTPMWIGLDEAQKYTTTEVEKIAVLFQDINK